MLWSKPFCCSSGCMLRFIVLLEGEPLEPCIFPDSAEEKHPQSMMLPPPGLTVGIVCRVSATCCILWGQKVKFWSHHTFLLACVNFQRDFLTSFSIKSRFIVVVLWRDYLPWAVDLCSSSRVTMDLLVASLINASLGRPVRLGGQRCLDSSAVVACSFHFLDDGFRPSVRCSKLGMFYF